MTHMYAALDSASMRIIFEINTLHKLIITGTFGSALKSSAIANSKRKFVFTKQCGIK